MEREITCSFTGHRPEKLPWRDNEADPRCVALKVRLDRVVKETYDSGMRHFLCGMARGADFYFCESVLKLRAEHPDVTLEAVIPCEEQAARWRERERERYFALVERCDQETMVQRHFDKGCMLRRNRYLVDHSARIIAVYDGMLGGTMYTLTYAMRQGLEVTILDPEEEKPFRAL
ncbi:SLOG family protein [uncultured Flavonifractor sp.]|uniref:SLOG family protein n=1 Tax=uncultured Flavonifractor sp. TaxID=1193534 RepID=UPI00261113B4|nr:SLOG family protein [uncultured Flavonifractor sp.]